MLNGENIPRVLIDLPNWIVWKHEIRNKKPTKVPYDAKSKGVYAKSNDVATWATFDVAFAAANDILNDYDGVGFMLQGTDLVGIDFDGVLHDGVAEPYVLDILEKLGNPYCEITPSGTDYERSCSAPRSRQGNVSSAATTTVRRFTAEQKADVT